MISLAECEGRNKVEGDIPSAWIIGKNKWASFTALVSAHYGVSLKEGDHQGDRGPLEAMFLGEKAVCFDNFLCEQYKTELEKFGFTTLGRYTYSPRLVAALVRKHAQEFADLPSQDPADIIEFISKTAEEEEAVRRGLLLGFPLPAVKEYVEREKLKVRSAAEDLYRLLPEGSPEQRYLSATFFSDKWRTDPRFIPFFIEKLQIHKERLGLNDSEIQKIYEEELPELEEIKKVDIRGIIWTERTQTPESQGIQERLLQAFSFLDC